MVMFILIVISEIKPLFYYIMRISHFIHGEGRAPIGEDVDLGLGITEQASHNVLNPNRIGPQATLTTVQGPKRSMMPEDPHNLEYWQTLIASLMQHIPLASSANRPKEDKLTDRVAKRNPKTYSRSYNPAKLEEWIRNMEKVFAIIEFFEEKKVTIRTFYFTGEANIWWNTMKVNSQDLNSLRISSLKS